VAVIGADDAGLVKPKAVVVVRPEARGRLAADPTPWPPSCRPT
jgi:hypothetical protein